MSLPPINEDDEYRALPMPIQMRYTQQQWLWLSDAEKARLIQTETEPDDET